MYSCVAPKFRLKRSMWHYIGLGTFWIGEIKYKSIFALSIYPLLRHARNPSLGKTRRACQSWMVNRMAANDFAMLGARASAAMVLTHFSGIFQPQHKTEYFCVIFSCDQAALWMVQSVRPSVCPSVTPLWLCSHHRIIMKFSGVIISVEVTSMQKVKVRGQRSRSQRSQPNLTVSGL